MERHFKACVCIDSQGEPTLYDENSEKSEVWLCLISTIFVFNLKAGLFLSIT